MCGLTDGHSGTQAGSAEYQPHQGSAETGRAQAGLSTCECSGSDKGLSWLREHLGGITVCLSVSPQKRCRWLEDAAEAPAEG